MGDPDHGLWLAAQHIVLEKRLLLGGLHDGSGCANLFGTKTHGLGSRMCNCRQPTHKDAFLQAPHANRKIELLTVTHSGTSAFRKRRQLRILGAQELAFADSCTFFVGMGDPDHGLWLAA